MQCPSCQIENPPANRFCDQCGAALDARCPRCNALVRAGARFCGACGQGLPAAQPAPSSVAAGPPARSIASYTPKHLAEKVLKARSAIEGERRQVTVLFADIAGFTSLAEGRDPEEVHQIVDRCFEAITAEVHRFEGTINQASRSRSAVASSTPRSPGRRLTSWPVLRRGSAASTRPS